MFVDILNLTGNWANCRSAFLQNILILQYLKMSMCFAEVVCLTMLWSPDLTVLVRTALGHGASSFCLHLSKTARYRSWDASISLPIWLGHWWPKWGQGKAVVTLQCCHAQSQGDVSAVLLSAWVAHAAGTKIYFLLFLLLDSDFCFLLRLHCAHMLL